jgi:hypothetical protein
MEEQIENVEQKRNPQRRIWISIACIIVLASVFFAFGSRMFTKETSMSEELQRDWFESQQLLAADLALHQRINRIAELDSLIMQNGSAGAGIDSLQAALLVQMREFDNTIDSVRKVSESYNKWANVLRSDSIGRSFAKVLTAMKRKPAAPDLYRSDEPVAQNDQNVIVNLQEQLTQKDALIASLKNELKDMETRAKQEGGSKPVVVTAEAATTVLENQVVINELTKQNRLLQQSVDQLKLESKGHESIQKKLRQQISRLENISTQERTLMEIARVDCNLNRADVNEIISNQKQRRYLLSEALTILNTLAQNADTKLQADVRQRMNRLNKISTTVRD